MTRRFAIAATASAAVVFALPGLAHAKYTAIAGSGSTTVAATSMRNATLFAAACSANTPAASVNLSWTKSLDTFVTSYVITRSGTGGTVTLPSVPAANPPAASDAPPTGAGNTYTYTIAAKVQSWTTSQSAGSTISYTGGGGGNKCQ
jgi:hypothetical protein